MALLLTGSTRQTARPREIALEGLQVAVEATRDSTVVRGVLPTELGEANFIVDEHTYRCLFNGEIIHDLAEF